MTADPNERKKIEELKKEKRTALIGMVNSLYRLIDGPEYRGGFKMAMHFLETIKEDPENMKAILKLVNTWKD
jgi:hypothetical protein